MAIHFLNIYISAGKGHGEKQPALPDPVSFQMGLVSALVNGVKQIVGKTVNAALSLVTPLALMKRGADEKSDPLAFLIHTLSLAVMALNISLCAVPNYATHDGTQSSLFDLNCPINDNLDCPGRLKGVQATTIITIILAVFNILAIKNDWFNGAFWSALYTFGASLTSFFLFYSFNSRVGWTDKNNLAHTMASINDGMVFSLSIASMCCSGLAFLGWTAFEINFLDPAVTQNIPDSILTILDVANTLLPPNGFAQKIRNIRFLKNPGEGAGGLVNA